jgi:hypothetical protein
MLPPLRSVAYLVVLREQNPHVLDELAHSFASLRRLHPDLPVLVYHDSLEPEQLEWLCALSGVIDMPIGVDRSGRFARNRYAERRGWTFPELHVLAAKIDVLLLTPGDTLFLDTDTEVRSSLCDVLEREQPAMYESEGLLVEHERDLRGVLAAIQWRNLGWQGDRARLAMFNSGAIWVPQRWKVCLYRAKELLWSLTTLPAAGRGDNRLDEQIALSIALQEACGGELGEVAPRVYHFWREKYESGARWYEPGAAPAAAACR